ncbi:ABC transporter permease [bacterium]|nr:ABC transporter permease [bacterium]
MTNILAIAVNTFREAIRKKVFYLILVFTLVLLGVAIAVASVSLAGRDRILITFGLFAVNVFGLLVVIFIGSQLLADETERKTIYTAISHGVTRSQFILGKYLGLCLTVLALTFFMTLLMTAVFYLADVPVDHADMFKAVILLLLSLFMVSGVAMLFSSFSTPVLSAVLTLLVWFICNFTLDVENHARYLADHQDQVVMPIVLKAIYVAFPNFAQYNQIRAVVYAHEPVELAPLLVLLAVLYTTVYLSLACWSFSTKDFE